MKRISFILVVIIVLSFVLSACADNGKKPIETTLSTTDAEITTQTPTTAFSQPTPMLTDPEPIYVGMRMTESDVNEAVEEFKKSNSSVIKLLSYVFWVDENGNNVVAEFGFEDEMYVVKNIERFSPVYPTQETFDSMINKEMTMQELVEIAGIPVGYGPTSGITTILFLDINLMNHVVHPGTNISVRSSESNIKKAFDEFVKVTSDKYSLENFEVHRIFVEKIDTGKYEICMQGAHGEEKTPWSISFDITEDQYNQFMSYRYGKNGILYNVVANDEYKSLCYIPCSFAIVLLKNEIN